MKNSFIGLALLLVTQTNVDKVNILYSQNGTKNIFGGIEEEYNMKNVRTEIEYKIDDDTNFTITPFYGLADNEIEYGLDFGLKERIDDIYFKGSVGYGYQSKEFENHDFRQNFHLNFGVGYEFPITEDLNGVVGGVFNHWSIGQHFTHREEHRKNHGINYGGLELGIQW